MPAPPHIAIEARRCLAPDGRAEAALPTAAGCAPPRRDGAGGCARGSTRARRRLEPELGWCQG
ncbi:hypothetical protein ACP70R_010907 [Stipagrostis hirtigluma subsp. patula]